VGFEGEPRFIIRKSIFLIQALVGEPIGLIQVGNEQWETKFSFCSMGILDERNGKITPNKKGRKV
jgi:hypothetical protein